MPRRVECRKIRLPVRAVAPVIYVPRRRRRTAEYDLAGSIVDQRESGVGCAFSAAPEISATLGAVVS